MTNNHSVSQISSTAKVSMAKDEVQFLATDSYNECSRVICHAIKENDKAAIVAAAYKMADCLPENSSLVLVPAPSRKGYATNTLFLAEMIARISGAEVADVLKGRERASNYESKKEGHPRLQVFYDAMSYDGSHRTLSRSEGLACVPWLPEAGHNQHFRQFPAHSFPISPFSCSSISSTDCVCF